MHYPALIGNNLQKHLAEASLQFVAPDQHFIISQKCSIQLKFGEPEGYLKTVTPSVSKTFFATPLICGGALSCMNRGKSAKVVPEQHT